MHLSDTNKFMFFHPSRKTGGTSVASALGKVSKDPFGDRHLRPSHVKERIPGKFARYYKFAFVRNPWDRLVSCYCYDNLVTEAFQKGQKCYGISFSDYLDMRFKEGKHWSCPQGDYLKINNKWAVDFIGRFETLAADFDIIVKAVGLRRIKLPHKRETKHNTYQEYYDARTERMVREAFQKDIDDFDYEFKESFTNGGGI